MKKLAFVIPWYGESISGGAEMECRTVAKHLHDAGIAVEILTTCVKDFNSDWNINYHKEGIDIVQGIPVRRFKVKKRDTRKFDEVNYKLIHNQTLTSADEAIFFNEMINSRALEEYIAQNQDEYQSFIFIPYMFGTTYFGSKACPKNAAAIPCLHDESYAYMNEMKDMFTGFKKIIFNADPERQLANKIYGLDNADTMTIGLGIDTKVQHDRNNFKKKFNITKPFILYAGRKDVGKNVDELLRYFEKLAKETQDIDLVLIGGGEIDISQAIKNRVHDLGFVDIQDKYNAYAASLCLCQPSKNESFSIVIMESWVAGSPVLVHQECDVTTYFAKTSNGGLYFNTYLEFKECVMLYLQQEELAMRMGQLGKSFVEREFAWDVVVKKYKEFLYNEV